MQFFKVSTNSCKNKAIQRRGVEANGAMPLQLSYLVVGDIYEPFILRSCHGIVAVIYQLNESFGFRCAGGKKMLTACCTILDIHSCERFVCKLFHLNTS